MFILQVTIQIQQTFAPQEGVRSLKFVISFPLWNPLSPHTESLFLMLVHFFSRLSFCGGGLSWEYDLLPRNKSLHKWNRLMRSSKRRVELGNVLSTALVQCKTPYSRGTSVRVCVCVCDALLLVPHTQASLSWMESSVFHAFAPSRGVVFVCFVSAPPSSLSPPPGPLSGRFLVGHVKINLRENKQQSTTTNTVNCLSAFLAGRSLTAGHTGSWHHFSQPLR